MEVRKAHPGRSERVDVRGREFGAEGTDIGKAPIVGEQDDDVGTVGRGLGGLRPRRKRADQGGDSDDGSTPGRSEEHTSELQSLMRIPYAVFCLQKTNKYRISKIQI